MNSLFSFLKSVFSEDGQGSYSRFVGGLIVTATLGWITYLILKNHVMPDLSGPTAFISLGSGSHYLTNKASEIVSAFKGKGTDNGQVDGK